MRFQIKESQRKKYCKCGRGALSEKMQGKEMSGFKEIVPHEREVMGDTEEKLLIVLENNLVEK